MLRIVAFCVLGLIVTTVAHARPSDKDFRQIQERLNQLEARVGDLESESTAPPEPPQDPEPPQNEDPPLSDNTDWLGFWANAYEYEDMEAWLGRPVYVGHFMLAFGHNGFQQALDDRQRKWLEDFTTLVPHVQLSFILDIFPERGKDPQFAAIAAGDWDAELRAVARTIIDTGHEDAILRLWHEPEVANKNNGPIGPTWCDDPAYIPAWRRVHDIFEAEAGGSFTWQYSVNGPAGAQRTDADGTLWIDLCYPGAAYVDQVSNGAYDRAGRDPETSWQRSLAKLVFVRDWAIAHGHQFSLAEWGLWDSTVDTPVCGRFQNGQGDNPSFIQRSHDFFAAIPEDWRGYMLYFNRMDCVNIHQFPESEALFEELFGG